VTESPDWRARRWAATHQRIYDAALSLFQEQGFDRVNIGQIVRAAGVSVPTFYAHYPSKEHLIMQLPTADDVAAIISGQPAELPLGERIRRAVTLFFGQWDMDAQLVRWRIIATTPSLRRRAAEFERATAELVAEAMPSASGSTTGPAEATVINAYLAAFTTGVLAWADDEGARKIEEHVFGAFDALEDRRA
jgi:AcrR family transcriptional regulator